MSSTDKSASRVAGGLKATINNPNISESTKDRAQERLRNMDVDEVPPSQQTYKPQDGDVLSKQEAGGFKATMNNPKATSDAKSHAKHVLDNTETSEVEGGHPNMQKGDNAEYIPSYEELEIEMDDSDDDQD